MNHIWIFLFLNNFLEPILNGKIFSDISEKIKNLLELDENSLKPRFFFTHKEYNGEWSLWDTIDNIPFDQEAFKRSSMEIEVIIHDINEKFNVGNYITDLSQAVVTRNEKLMVLIVDWSKGSKKPLLFINDHAKRTTEWIAYRLLLLVEKSVINPKNIKFIGKGFGAHLAGMTSKYLIHHSIIVERIIALNPTITMMISRDKSVRLDSSDAKQTVSIFTEIGLIFFNSFSLNPFSIDTYIINGGEFQPNCYNPFKSNFLTEFFYCSEYRAAKILENLYRNKAYFLIGFKCEYYTKLHYCNKKFYGENIGKKFNPNYITYSDKNTQTYYTDTLSISPYIGYPILLKIEATGFNMIKGSITMEFDEKIRFYGIIPQTFYSDNLVILLTGENQLPLHKIPSFKLYSHQILIIKYFYIKKINVQLIGENNPQSYDYCQNIGWNGGVIEISESDICHY